MGRNFHVERHLKFEVENGVKSWSTPSATIHRCQERSHLGKQFVQNLLIKTYISLFKSCRGSADLQLFYSHLGALILRNLEIKSVKLAYPELLTRPNERVRDVVCGATSARLRTTSYTHIEAGLQLQVRSEQHGHCWPRR
jgi:hypothetical protein